MNNHKYNNSDSYIYVESKQNNFDVMDIDDDIDIEKGNIYKNTEINENIKNSDNDSYILLYMILIYILILIILICITILDVIINEILMNNILYSREKIGDLIFMSLFIALIFCISYIKNYSNNKKPIKIF